MNDSVWFRAWVANAVHEVSGIWAYDWRGSKRKCPLTIEEIRMAACQEGLLRKFDGTIQESMRLSARVNTNKRSEPRKLH